MTRSEKEEILDFMRRKEAIIYERTAAMRAKHHEKRNTAPKRPMTGEDAGKLVGFK